MIGIAFPVFYYYLHSASKAIDNHKNISHYQQHRQPRHEIRGFSLESNHEGKKVISIKADRFSIKKKKLGFLSFGLMNEAGFENAIIRIYGKSEPAEGSEVGSRRSGVGRRSVLSGKRSDELPTNIKVRKNLTLKGVFSKDILPSFKTKKISSIVMNPVCLELHDEQSLVTRISAASAVVRLKKRYIIFKGNVKVVSDKRVLTTTELSLFPEKAAIRTDQHFILKTPEKNIKGDHLTFDIFLRPVFRLERQRLDNQHKKARRATDEEKNM